MNIRKRTLIRKTAAFVLGTALCLSCVVNSYAAAAKATVDETLYLNLDYYGTVTNANMVKSIRFNSQETYRDYGSYESLINMSNSDEIIKDGESVILTAPEDGSRLYFQGTMANDAITPPWTIDVSYKLNGVPANAADLAGASGLIEMDIDAYPVRTVSDYMRNNFVLMVAIPVDTGDYYSVDAPDSQTANIGEYSCVVFESLPGQEASFAVRFGTDCFETVGAIIMMSPVTVGDLENIKDIDELETKFRDNTNAMMDDLEALMDNLTDMSDELSLTNQMLDELKKGKDIVHGSSSVLFNGTDVAIQDLRDLAASITPIDSSLLTMQWMVYDIYSSLNDMDQDMLTMSTRIKTLNNRLKDLGSAMSDIDAISLSDIESEWEVIEYQAGGIEDSFEKIKNTDEFRRTIASSSDYVQEKIKDDEDMVELLSGGTFVSDLEYLADSLSELAEDVADAYDQDAEALAGLIVTVSEDIEDLSSLAGTTIYQTARVMECMRTLTGDLDEMINVMNNYYDDIQDLLTYSDNMLLEIQRMSDDLAYVLQVANDTLKAAEESFSNAADAGIQAGEQTVDSAFEMLDNITDLKESGKDLRKSINDELDEQEEENNFLKMDPYATKISLTSTKNPEPASVAIICRTEEISAEDDEIQAILDAEDAEAESTVLERMKNVFIRIYEAVLSVIG